MPVDRVVAIPKVAPLSTVDQSVIARQAIGYSGYNTMQGLDTKATEKTMPPSMESTEPSSALLVSSPPPPTGMIPIPYRARDRFWFPCCDGDLPIGAWHLPVPCLGNAMVWYRHITNAQVAKLKLLPFQWWRAREDALQHGNMSAGTIMQSICHRTH